jgi:hypothetical protein
MLVTKMGLSIIIIGCLQGPSSEVSKAGNWRAAAAAIISGCLTLTLEFLYAVFVHSSLSSDLDWCPTGVLQEGKSSCFIRQFPTLSQNSA